MPEFYAHWDSDAHSWEANNTTSDFIGDIIKPEKLQPFLAMPIFFGIKQLIVIVAFGYALNFKRQEPAADWKATIMKYAKEGAKSVVQIAFIAMSCNGYIVDRQRIIDNWDDASTGWRKFSLITTTMLISSNYVAAVGIWTTLKLENPATLLELKPTYLDLSCCYLKGVPVFPCQASWLPSLKHLYAFILFPYFIFGHLVQLVIALAAQYWMICITKCCALIKIFMISCCCVCGLFGTIISLGFWGWAHHTLLNDWGMLKVLYTQVLIQVWASAISPRIFAFIYGIVIGAGADNIGKAFTPSAKDTAAVAAGPFEQARVRLDDDDIKLLKELNAEKIVGFVHDPSYSALGSVDAEGQTPDAGNQTQESEADSLADAKVKIFVCALESLALIVINQVSSIFVARALETTSFRGYVSALYLTCTERSLENYVGHIQSIGDQSLHDAIDTFWTLS